MPAEPVPAADLVRCPECQRDGCDWDDEDIVTCPACGHAWGVYESGAGIKLFMQRERERIADA